MPVFRDHDDEVFIVFDWRDPFLLIDNDRSLRGGKLEPDVRMVPRHTSDLTHYGRPKSLPVSTVVTHLKLEFVIVEMTWRDRPSRDIGYTVTERGEELTESVPVHGRVVVG